MQHDTYDQYTHALVERLATDQRVIALVAIGSMADSSRRDQWSDHDFWVITQAGTQESVLSDISWLPDAPNIILPFRQGTQYYTVLYRNGHSVEFAVFDIEQIQQGKINRYSMLIDKADIAPAIQHVYEQTRNMLETSQAACDDQTMLNYFFLHLWSGVQKYLRGERLMSQKYISYVAVNQLLCLLQRWVPPYDPMMRDSFDPWRYIERVYPQIAQEIQICLIQPGPHAALGLLEIAETYLAAHIPIYPYEFAGLIRSHIGTALSHHIA
jgi:hypothetical protein